MPTDTLHDEVVAFVAAELPFCDALGIEIERIEDGQATARLYVRPEWRRPGGFTAGGAIVTLADIAAYVAVFSRTGVEPMAVTSGLDAAFLRPATGPIVRATATLLGPGRRLLRAGVDVTDDDRFVARATVTYALPGG